jgi:hypothetical protein
LTDVWFGWSFAWKIESTKPETISPISPMDKQVIIEDNSNFGWPVIVSARSSHVPDRMNRFALVPAASGPG